MDPDLVEAFIRDVQKECSLEIEQGVMKHDLYQANAALGGKDACERILRRIQMWRERQRPEPLRTRKAG